MTLNPKVIDISHYDGVVSPPAPFSQLAGAGIIGVIHKATEGIGYDDPLYEARRKYARDADLLWGAYHFNTGAAVGAQVDHFMRAADPDANTLMAIDFEDNTASEMSIGQLAAFLRLLDAQLGRPAVVYGGSRLKELLPHATDDDMVCITGHKLWLSEYGPVPRLPQGWRSYFLWQFTGDGIGPQPHSMPGITANGLDINHYDGTDAELTQEWAT